jgi:hypothetical protein
MNFASINKQIFDSMTSKKIFIISRKIQHHNIKFEYYIRIFCSSSKLWKKKAGH